MGNVLRYQSAKVKLTTEWLMRKLANKNVFKLINMNANWPFVWRINGFKWFLSMVINHKRNDHIKRANKTTIYEFLTIQLPIQSSILLVVVLLPLLLILVLQSFVISLLVSSFLEFFFWFFFSSYDAWKISQVINASLITTTETK